MWWFRPRRRKRQWFGLTSRFHRGSAGPTVTPSPPYPTPRELVGVVGVGATETVNGEAITLLALERYREADIVTFRFARPRRGRHEFHFPELDIGVTGGDDVARRVWAMGGGGGGGDELIFRHAYAFAPPTPEAREVVIEVRKIDWMKHSERGRGVGSTDVGPWRFTIKP